MERDDVARHRKVRERRSVGPVALTAMVLVAGVGGAGAMWLIGGDEDGVGGANAATVSCSGPSITVAAAPEIAPTLRDVVVAEGCSQIAVEEAAPALVSAQVAAGKDVPDVWIPDSSSWVARAAGSAPTAPEPLVESLAISPVVLVSGAGKPPTTWLAALASDDLVPGDPLTSATASVPLVAGAAEATRDGVDLAPTLVPLAQSQVDERRDAPDDVGRLDELANDGVGVTAVSEQAYLAAAPDLKASVPKSGTVVLDYPVLLTTAEERRGDIDETTQALMRILGDASVHDALTAAGFRSPDGSAVEGGVGAFSVLKTNAKQVRAVLQTWGTLVLPTRALSVVDVSGSMDFEAAGGQTRIQLLTAATTQGLTLFPDAAAIGLWAFSERLDGDTDYRELVPIRALGSRVGGQTQRAAIQAGTASLASLTGGGTGLYDTTLAAYKTVLDAYDPNAANAVMLFTDGANDDPGSISLSQLLQQLRDLADPTRPVRIIAIGISGDADESALRQIAQSTGGQAYVAEDPADIPTVFLEAMGARTG
ncbi:substrate-binding domain-containing protein [Nocardioides sp. YIM 152588]|uniref:substrate-binding domain-containing protein n=1 Tax=Nocardioides sp. YIM 152588 TaxID=3158259 RepID=UPI0032E4353B